MHEPTDYHPEWSKPTPVSDSPIPGWGPRICFLQVLGSMDAAGPRTTFLHFYFHMDWDILSCGFDYWFHLPHFAMKRLLTQSSIFKEHSAIWMLQEGLTECHCPSKIWEKIRIRQILMLSFPSIFHILYNENTESESCSDVSNSLWLHGLTIQSTEFSRPEYWSG